LKRQYVYHIHYILVVQHVHVHVCTILDGMYVMYMYVKYTCVRVYMNDECKK
jgi:hypothetical protein